MKESRLLQVGVLILALSFSLLVLRVAFFGVRVHHDATVTVEMRQAGPR